MNNDDITVMKHHSLCRNASKILQVEPITLTNFRRNPYTPKHSPIIIYRESINTSIPPSQPLKYCFKIICSS